MKIQNILLVSIIGLFFVSCNESDKWPEDKEVEFTTNCTSSYVISFKASAGADAMSQIDLDKLDEMAEKNCSCMYESLKKNYDSADEAFEAEQKGLLPEFTECEPSDAEIDDLFLK